MTPPESCSADPAASRDTTKPETAMPAPRRAWWRRWLRDPLMAQLTQGVSPDKLAATLAVGAGCSLFPFLGTTSALNFFVGAGLRMNQPILQTLNQLLGPLQLVMIVAYVRLGETLWGATEDRFSVGDVVQVFREQSFAEFLERFGWAGVHAFTAWLVTTPLLVAALYLGFQPLMRAFAARRSAGQMTTGGAS